jgi:glycosyltransferase involved in cell wall biosynthesis
MKPNVMKRIFICEPFASYQVCHANSVTQSLAIALAKKAEVLALSVKKFYEFLPDTSDVKFFSLFSKSSKFPQAPGRGIQLLMGLTLVFYARWIGLRQTPAAIVWPNGSGVCVWLTRVLFPKIPVLLILHSSIVSPETKTGLIFRCFWFFEKRALLSLSRRGMIATVSEQNRKELEQYHCIHMPSENVLCIGFQKRCLSLTRPFQSRVVIFGSITSRKNYPCAIRGFLQQTTFHELVVAGAVQDASIPLLIQKLDVDKRIQLMPRYISEMELDQLYKSADVSLQPHGYTFTLPSGTLSRALEFGLPIVGPDKGPIADWINNYSIGITFASDDPESLARSLSQLGERYTDYYQYFCQGYEKLSEDWSWDSVANKLIQRLECISQSTRVT